MVGSKLSDASSIPVSPLRTTHDDQALGSTVHSLPSVDAQAVKLPGRSVGRWKMIMVLAICAAPVIASYFTYYVIRPEARRVFGELIDPQRPLPNLGATGMKGENVNLLSLKGQWLLISVSGGACDENCQRHLYLQRQMRESLGKEKDRVDRVWLVSDDAQLPDALRPALKDATVLRASSSALAQWLTPAAGHALADHLYLVDPLGNLMMRFPASLNIADAAKAKGDLDRVLRASASWDKAGR